MFLKVIIISVILVALIMLTLGIKLLFDPHAEFSSHSCALEDGSLDKTGVCSNCRLSDTSNCPVNKIDS